MSVESVAEGHAKSEPTRRQLRHHVSAQLLRSGDLIPPPHFRSFLAKLGCYLTCSPGEPCERLVVKCAYAFHNVTPAPAIGVARRPLTSAGGDTHDVAAHDGADKGAKYVNFLATIHGKQVWSATRITEPPA